MFRVHEWRLRFPPSRLARLGIATVANGSLLIMDSKRRAVPWLRLARFAPGPPKGKGALIAGVHNAPSACSRPVPDQNAPKTTRGDPSGAHLGGNNGSVGQRS